MSGIVRSVAVLLSHDTDGDVYVYDVGDPVLPNARRVPCKRPLNSATMLDRPMTREPARGTQ